MKCLTLWRPWPWVIFHAKKSAETGHGRKLVENRDWPPPKSLMGDRLALHAGKTWDREGAAFIQRTLGLTGLPPEAWQEGIVGTTRVIGVALNPTDCAPDQRVWFFGSHGWLLEERSTLALPKPIAIKGAQGVWTLPPDVATEIDKLIPVEVMCQTHGVSISGPGQACTKCVAEDPPPELEDPPFLTYDPGHVGGDALPLMRDELVEMFAGLKPVPRPPEPPATPPRRKTGRDADRDDARRRAEDEAHERMGRLLGLDEGEEP